MKILISQELYLCKNLLKTSFIWMVFICSYNLIAQDSNKIQNSDSSFAKIKEDIAAAENIGDSIQSYLSFSEFFITQRPNPDSAIFYSNKAYILSTKNFDSISAGRAKLNLAMAFNNLGEHQKAMEEINMAISLFRQIGNNEQLYFSQNILGITQMRAGNLDLALETYLKAVDYYKSQNDSEKLIVIYNNIGIIYMNLNDMKKAKSFLEHAIEFCDKLSNTGLCEDSFQNLANVYRNEEDYENSIKYNNIALSIVLNNNNLVASERIYSNMAYAYYLMKDIPNTIQYSQKSLDVFAREQEDFNTIEANTFHTLGLAYLEQNDFKKAEKYLIIAHEVGTKLNYSANLPEFEFGLYTFYNQIGNYKKALTYYKDYVDAKERISGSKMRSNISEIEEIYFTLEKEKEIDAIELIRQKENEQLKARIYLIGSITSILGILFIAFVQRQKRVLAENKQKISENKYDSLRSQMNPHFIFNTINGVQNQILKSDKLEAYEHLNKFADTIRLMLDNSTKSFINLEKEIELLEHYVLLESVRFSKKFSFEINVENDLKELNPIIPAMILQPIAENAIIHGLSNKQSSGHLSIDFHLKGQSVFCCVKDNGIGRVKAMQIKNKKIGKHLSIATENTQQRIKLLQKLGYKKSSIKYTDLYDNQNDATGTKVEVVLPIQYLS